MLERAFAVVVLFLSTGGLLPFLRAEGGVATDPLEVDPLTRIVWLPIYGITFLLLAQRPKEIVRLLAKERWAILLCGLAVASSLWSVAPDITLRHSAVLLGTTGLGVYLASRYTAHELLRLVGWALAGAVALSLAFVVFVPANGVGDSGPWQGIFLGKNALGRVAALAVVVMAVLLRQRGLANRLVPSAILVLSCVELVQSGSVASLVTASAVLISMPLYSIFRFRSALAIASASFALIALTGAAMWISTSPEVLMSALGRDATLTGRTRLWDLCVDAITTRPWLGHGYAAFWLGLDGESATIWKALVWWQAANAHNGFLDLALEIGLAGVALFATGFAAALWRAVGVIRRTASAYGSWPLAYLLFFLFFNLAESTMTMQKMGNGIFCILYVVTCIWLIRPRNDERTGSV